MQKPDYFTLNFTHHKGENELSRSLEVDFVKEAMYFEPEPPKGENWKVFLPLPQVEGEECPRHD